MIRTLVVVAAVSLFPLSASANQIEDSIVSQLRSQGFTKIELSRTFLGRARVTARSPTLDREIIYNPVTGAILRDYWTERSNGRIGVTLVDPNNPASHTTGGRSDDNGGEGDDGGDDGGDGDD